MLVKTFGDKEIVIRKPKQSDAARAKDFQDFINSLVEEKAQILENKRQSPKQVREYLSVKLKEVRAGKAVLLLAKREREVVARAEIYLKKGHSEYVGILRIAIKRGYRGMGLGSFLMKEILKLAKQELKPKPKVIRLSMFSANERAKKLYQKFGFRQVARVPKQYYYQGKMVDELIMILEV